MRAASQLPPGRHGLSRTEVRESQRRRMLVGMGRAVAERGYAGTSVGDVIRRAGVSRETFYEQFANKEDCFLAAFDDAVARLTGEMAGSIARHASPVQRFDAALRVYLDVLSAEPALAKTFLIEVYAAGPAVLGRRAEVLGRFVELMAESVGAMAEDRRFACEVLVSAVSSMVTMRIAAGEEDALPSLHAPVMKIAQVLLGS